MAVPEKMHAPADMAECAANWTPVPLLEDIKEHARAWVDLAEQYGVTNPDPPWKTSLDGMCEVLASRSCSSMAASKEKRPTRAEKFLGVTSARNPRTGQTEGSTSRSTLLASSASSKTATSSIKVVMPRVVEP